MLRSILTFVLAGYGIVVYDKAILGSAALLGMKSDLELAVGRDTSRLSLATSLFYIGQLTGSYPSSYLVQHYRTRWVVGPAVIVWAIVATSTAGCTSYKGLYAQRFFLGEIYSRPKEAHMANNGRLVRVHNPYFLHDHHKRLLHSKRAGIATSDLVQRRWVVHCYWRGHELWLRADQEWSVTFVAILLCFCRAPHVRLRNLVFLSPGFTQECLVPEP